MKNNVSVRKLARCAVVAALYVVLCMALQPLSYGAVQVRVAEALCLLPVFGAEYIAGVVLGCFLANLLGSTIVDVILGTLATLLACVVTYKLRNVRIGGLAILIGTVLGLLLGVCAALHRGKFLDGFCTVFSIVGVCVPSYVFLIFLQYNFSYKVSFFPYFFDSSRFLFSAILPALSLSLFTMSTIARFTRNEMVEVIDSDYVRLAESKGMEGGLLIRRHVLRNALVPIVTVLAPLIVDLLTGALVVEKIYGINGIGKLMVDAIAGEGVDYNYVLALGILYSSLYIGMMLAVDILYGILDPRIRVSAKGEA